jgi:hypothetical protein
MICSIALGAAVILCGPDESMMDYREGLRRLTHEEGYRAGMPVLIDARSWGQQVAGDVVARRVAVLMKFIEPTIPLRVAVVMTDPAATNGDIARLRQVGIIGACFHTVDVARMWLAQTDSDSARQTSDDGLVEKTHA